ncbi:MAG: hypothetical protein ACFE0O_03315 [Opitutales bacterium]
MGLLRTIGVGAVLTAAFLRSLVGTPPETEAVADWPLPTLYDAWPALTEATREAARADPGLAAARGNRVAAETDLDLRKADHRIQARLNLRAQGELENREFAGGQTDRGGQGRLLFDLAFRRQVYSWGRQAARLSAGEHRLAAARMRQHLAEEQFLMAWVSNAVSVHQAANQEALARQRLATVPTVSDEGSRHLAANRIAALRAKRDRLLQQHGSALQAWQAARTRFLRTYGLEPPDLKHLASVRAPEPSALAAALKALARADDRTPPAARLAKRQAAADRADAIAAERATRPRLSLISGATQEDRRNDLIIGEERFRQFAYGGLLLEWAFLDGGAARNRARRHQLEAQAHDREAARLRIESGAKLTALQTALRTAWADWEPAPAAPLPRADADEPAGPHLSDRERANLQLAAVESRLARNDRVLDALLLSTRAAIVAGWRPTVPLPEASAP